MFSTILNYKKRKKKFKNLLDFGKIRLKNGKFLKTVYAHKTPVSPRLTFGNYFFDSLTFLFFKLRKIDSPKRTQKREKFQNASSG